MTYRITKNIAEKRLEWVNNLLNEIGSEYSLDIEYPWSAYFLALTDKDSKKKHCYLKTYSQCGFREIADFASTFYDILYYLKQEGLLRKKEIIEK